MRANWKVKVLKKVVQDILEQERNVETRTGENWGTQGGSISLYIKKKKVEGSQNKSGLKVAV